MPHKTNFFAPKGTLNLGGKLMQIKQPLVMGILNVTPDSFYDGGEHYSESSHREALQAKIEKYISEEVDIIDIGGMSSRPGAELISAAEELERVLPAIELCKEISSDTILSIDTYRAEVAEQAVEAGVRIVNDISAGHLDAGMLSTVGKLKVPYCMMHMKGNPQTMQKLTQYEDLVAEVIAYFEERIEKALAADIKDIFIDPGFGFAKTAEQNFTLLRELKQLQIFNFPILAGLSRKSMIYKTLNTDPEGALNGTSVLNSIALMNGAKVLRVHDVKAAKEAITLLAVMEKE